MEHASVLLHEAIDGLDIREGDAFLDCTLGGGGHSLEVCRRHGGAVRLIGLDADEDAIARSRARLEAAGCAITAVKANFRDLDSALGPDARVDRVLMDLGTSSYQIEGSGRGFTFRKDEPLLMTLGKSPAEGGFTAEGIVNSWEEENIETILRAYGDERYARRIARGIAEAREKGSIKTTGQLVGVIEASVPAAYRRGRIHPATRTFQALRIAANDELRALAEGLSKAFGRLNPGGRMAVISFHSGEDRIVKNFFRDKAKDGEADVVTKKPIVPSGEEVAHNPRARSAKLRILFKKQETQ